MATWKAAGENVPLIFRPLKVLKIAEFWHWGFVLPEKIALNFFFLLGLESGLTDTVVTSITINNLVEISLLCTRHSIGWI